MEKFEVEPNVISVNTILHVLSRIDGERAMNWFQSLENKMDIQPDFITFNSMLQGLSKHSPAPSF